MVDFFADTFLGLVILAGDGLGSRVGDRLARLPAIFERLVLVGVLVEVAFGLRLLEGTSSVAVVSFSTSDLNALLSCVGEPSCGAFPC